jgi:hypothetical protein
MEQLEERERSLEVENRKKVSFLENELQDERDRAHSLDKEVGRLEKSNAIILSDKNEQEQRLLA